MRVTGIYLGRHVQLYQLALWVPLDIQLLSIVRRLERFLENPEVEPRKLFKPFVYAMQTCFGGQTVYLIIDCTQVGKKCRSLMIAVAYHQTVLPVVWKTVQGGKEHVKGSLQKAAILNMRRAYSNAKRLPISIRSFCTPRKNNGRFH